MFSPSQHPRLGQASIEFLTLPANLNLKRACFFLSLSETILGVRGSIRRESNQGPRVYPDLASKILRVTVGSFVSRWFGPIRARGPGEVSKVSSIFTATYHSACSLLQISRLTLRKPVFSLSKILSTVPISALELMTMLFGMTE